MPQVDLETFVCSDRKIACETLSDNKASTHDPIDFSPESYSLSVEAHVEWLNENAFFERKSSQKRNSSHPNHNSQRISLKSKASIMRLPKPQKTCFNEAKKRRNCRIARTLMIPKRLKSDIHEPSSPKVSCIGRVRSKRERSRRMHRQKSARTDSVKKPGFFANFKAIFRTGGGCKDLSREAVTPPRVSTARRSTDIRERLPPGASPPRMRRSVDGGEPVLSGLAGMNRFTSGRRPELVEVVGPKLRRERGS